MGDLDGLDVVLLGWGADPGLSPGAQEISYGSGLLIGEQFIDTVTLGNLVITKQGVGSATLAIGFEDGTTQIHDALEGAKQWYGPDGFTLHPVAH